ncbi:sensor histidine kinase [Chengkuizengella axinellae]|uniref:Heme sensor protein HssS n=1 Tax=Chengkuizengella axinellae TaxID=3064388 RepID=A0ABT9IZS8_9BACL|nr:HAMP domain-containing sensor histidine kinase [Chengkuizengella sp. 2205SS18-9]MDP5274881.1 ATP-binding protein [Chengkuizengella sp. 2205SS18-9]
MRKSIYIRYAYLFIAAVLVSLMLGILAGYYTFFKDYKEKLDQTLIEVGEEFIELYKTTPEESLESFFNNKTLFTYRINLFNEQDEVISYGSEFKNYTIQNTDIELVLKGETFSSDLYEWSDDPAERIVGLPLEMDNQRYALFISPDFPEEWNQLRHLFQIILFTVLVVGSILFSISATYLVIPIRRLTKATKELAKGNYDVHIKHRRKDEIGDLTDSFNHMTQQLHKLETMRQEFVGNVSHEIQSPLTSIRGFTRAIKDNLVKEEDRHKYLQIIEDESKRLSKLSEDLLKLASLDSEQHPFHPKMYSLDEQIRQVVVKSEPLWSQKNLKIDLSLPKVMIHADEFQLEQVWINLFTNSIRYTPENKKITISVYKYESVIKIIFKDTGIGIKSEDLDHIFERFYKADKARTRSFGGNGLGLSIAHKIVSIHHGQIKVDSEFEKGTSFTVILPIRQEV